jgi:hypothetical protein
MCEPIVQYLFLPSLLQGMHQMLKGFSGPIDHVHQLVDTPLVSHLYLSKNFCVTQKCQEVNPAFRQSHCYEYIHFCRIQEGWQKNLSFCSLKMVSRVALYQQ